MRVFGRTGVVLAALLGFGAAAAPAVAQDAYKSNERAAEHQSAEYQAELRPKYAENAASALAALAADPERQFATDVCWHGALACAGDVRLYDFEKRGRGLVTPTLWTARNGSTVSGHVWMTKDGPAKRPGIVITNGSIQAPEELYWFAAQTLAKAGYVVVTFDPQQQGKSDTYGAGADAREGVPSQTEGNTFYDWTQDATDFLLSSPEKPFCARPSRSGTSHCPKQKRRVGERRNAAFNPYHAFVDPDRIGIAGHSYGASGVSWIGQQDRRVDAVVAWDNLCAPIVDSPDECSRGGQGAPPGLRVPSLGLAADTFGGSETSSNPDPLEKSLASKAFSEAGVDTGSITIRGGTHFEFSYLPSSSFKATLRGIDLTAWYTTAWFDKYVKGDRAADARLISDRWRHDPGDRAVDPAGGGNLLSRRHLSRLDIGLEGGGRFLCEDLRKGCAGQVPAARDGGPERYSYLEVATSKDGTKPAPAGGGGPGGRPAARACRSRRVIRLTARRVRGVRVRRVRAFARGREVGRSRGRRLTVRLTGLPAGPTRVTLRIEGRRGGRAVRVRQARTFRLCVPR